MELLISICVSQKKWANLIQPLEVRISVLRKYLDSIIGGRNQYEIIVIQDKYGPAVIESELEAIVVTPENENVAQEINQIRVGLGMNPLEVVVVELLTLSGIKISSTEIRKELSGKV